MATHLLHGLWTNDYGLALWIEQIDGHKIVLPNQVPTATFPPVIEAELQDATFRHRINATLKTPRGRTVELAIPIKAYTPEQAVGFFARTAFLDGATPAATQAQRATIAPDLAWLIRMYRGLEQFVRAGRLVLRCAWDDNSWWPQWQLASGMGEQAWIAEMTAAMPGVLAANGGAQVGELLSDQLPHWIASALLEELRDAARPSPWHEFSSSLMHSRPLRRGGAGLVSKLNDWKNSAVMAGLELVVIVEEPPEDEAPNDTDYGPLWPVRVHIRTGIDAPVPVHLRHWNETAQQHLLKLHKKLLREARTLRDGLQLAPLRSPFADQMDGEWDVWLDTTHIVDFVVQDIPKLKAAGINVMLPKTWGSYEPQLRMETRSEGESNAAGTKIGMDQIVEYNWRLSLGEMELTDSEMRTLVDSKAGLVKLRGKWMMADAAALRAVARYMNDLATDSEKRLREEITKLQAQAQAARDNQEAGWEELAAQVEQLRQELANRSIADGQASVAKLREIAVQSAVGTPVEFTGSQWHTSLLGGTVTPAPERVTIPPTVQASLREYQRRGVDWLYWMSTNNLGCILADDMGLGKTLQLLTLLAVEKHHDSASGNSTGPTLVVCPTSVVGNWAFEVAKFVPSLKVLVQYGRQRRFDEDFVAAATDVDLVITSYGIVGRDTDLFQRVDWNRVVLDEAQQIKNSTTQAARAVRSLPSRHRLALTGTPVENRLTELRSILDFCNPGILGSASFFRNHFATAIEKYQDEQVAEKLRLLTAPFILRRVKTDPSIIDDLPDKNEEIITVRMTTEQAALYTALVDDIQERLESSEGMVQRGLVLATITKIKQICNHPAHFLGDGSPLTLRGKHRSGKVEALVSIVDDAVERGDRVLVFTQYRSFGDILAPYLSDRLEADIPFLHGGVSKTGRDKMVHSFQQPEGPPVMILSLKAGGIGLNLTAASIVVHMDRWWNPAVENQATDRAYRIGQRRNVQVYKMVTRGTMEESIQDIIEGKLELAGAVIGQGEGWITELAPEQLAQLMSYRGRE